MESSQHLGPNLAVAGQKPADPGRRSWRRAATYGDLPIAALAMVLALQSGETNSLSLTLPGMERDLHVSLGALGFLPIIASLAGIIAVVPFGALADRRRRTWILAASMTVWIAFMAFNGSAPTLALLMLARFGTGAIEASGPAAVSLIGDYYPVKMRASKMGWYQLGALLGAIFGYAAIGAAIDSLGWRWGFYMWLPVGAVCVFLLLLCKEPARGDQDADYHAELQLQPLNTAIAQNAELNADDDLARVQKYAKLPPPRRTSTLDYRSLKARQIIRELLRIRSMWAGVASITVSQLLLVGIGFYAPTYFITVHHLNTFQAGIISSLLALGSVVGVLTGGKVSDALLRRGHVNGRIWIIAGASVIASSVLVPAFLSTRLAVTAPLLFVGGTFLLIPLAPSEAMLVDVVPCELRGRATTVRSVVRSMSALGTVVIGLMINSIGIREALAYFAPIFAIGGLLVLTALGSYSRDLSFVLAETERTRGGQQLAVVH